MYGLRLLFNEWGSTHWIFNFLNGRYNGDIVWTHDHGVPICYINASIFLLLLHVKLPLTHIYPTIFSSRVSHCLFVGFKTSLLGPWTSPTSFPLWVFSFPYAHHPWAFRLPWAMCHLCTLIHGNPVHLCLWELGMATGPDHGCPGPASHNGNQARARLSRMSG